jgi:two-component system sensor histidine kinase QseC
VIARPTLQRQLLTWVLGALTAVWTVLIIVGYFTGVNEADELTDGHLAGVASLLLAQPDPRFTERLNPDELGISSDLSAHDYQRSLSVVIWDGSGKVIARTGLAPDPSYDIPEGFETVSLGEPAASWRVFSRWSDASHQKKIAILLSIKERNDLVSDIAMQVAAPGFWLLPTVAIVLILAIRRGLRPLNDLSERVRVLDVNHVDQLHAPPHAEFQAMVHAIATLSGRYRAALARERELADSFAHELRTPLASMALHMDSLRGALTPQEHEAALAQLEKDTVRTTAIINDLLALARASRVELADAAQPIDLVDLVKEVVNEFAQHAYESGHELSISIPDHLLVQGHPVLLGIALRNLMTNALGHTPAGTTIEIRLTTPPVALHVCDNGSAVHQQRTAMKNNGAWVTGLGLGHKVVQRIAAVHDGRFLALPRGEDGWQCYTIEFGKVSEPASKNGVSE